MEENEKFQQLNDEIMEENKKLKAENTKVKVRIKFFDLDLTCLACKSSGIYPVDCFQQGARTSRFGAKPPAPQYFKVATTSR